MEPELTAEQACRQSLLEPEDFARMCNKDGTLKKQPKTTTFTLKTKNSKSVTIDNRILQGTVVSILLTLIILVVLFLRHQINTK